MTLFIDSSALLKRYIEEEDSDRYDEILNSDPNWVMARHARIEVRRVFAMRLEPGDVAEARVRFDEDWHRSQVVELDSETCDLAAGLAETTQARTLDALHLAAAQRVGGGALPFVTADLRQAQVARSLGWVVLGT